MEMYLADTRLTLCTALLFWAILAAFMHVERRRFRNCFLLLVALGATVPFLCSLAGDNAFTALVAVAFAVGLVLLIVPFFLMVNGIIVLRREGLSLAHCLPLFFGLFILAGEVACFGALWNFVRYYTSLRWQQLTLTGLLLAFGLSVFYVSLVFVSFMLYNGLIQSIPRTRDFDYVIIHGAGLLHGKEVSPLLRSRIDKAIRVYRKDPTPPVLVPSGGKGGDETVSEARAIADYLLSQGIPPEKILLEDRSTTTMENLELSAKLIQARPGRHFTALVTSNYHVYRALSYTQELGFPCTGIGSHTAFYYWPSALIREFAAIVWEKRNRRRFLLGWALLMGGTALLMLLQFALYYYR